MAKIIKSKAVTPNMVDLLDNVRMSESKRALAKAYARDAELFAALVSRAGSGLVSAVAGIEHGCGTLARRIRSSFKDLAHH